ncbi:MAG: CpsD/CapB family tyrosine-protein kinase [Clostridia bacterium]|nr:CpsD/CapB family tyrosine-protein kinase [Clostridia bacterium]
MLFFKKKEKDNFDTDVPKIVIGRKNGKSESYNRLKDNIIYGSDNGNKKVFQIESSISGEGKSTIAVNLAVALVKSGKKVCVLDLDFRRPKMHRAFSIPNFNGLAEYMLGESKREDLIKTTEYGVDVINRGKAAQNASIIFTSNKFKNLIAELREIYDIILFDCPPVLLVSDYMHISKLSDEVIFVVSAGVTHRSQLKEAVELLKRNDVKIFGVVMTYHNNGKFGVKYGGYYNGRYYKGVKNRYLSEK